MRLRSASDSFVIDSGHWQVQVSALSFTGHAVGTLECRLVVSFVRQQQSVAGEEYDERCAEHRREDARAHDKPQLQILLIIHLQACVEAR